MIKQEVELTEIDLGQAVERIKAIHHLGNDMIAYSLLHLGIDYYLKSLVQKEVSDVRKSDATPS